MLRLGAITGNERWTRRAESIIDAAEAAIVSVPGATGGLLSATARAEGGMATVSVIGGSGDPFTSALIGGLRRRPLPRVVVGARAIDGDASPAVLSGTLGRDGRAAATVCRAGACGPPLSEPEAVLAALGVPTTYSTGQAAPPEADPTWPER
jgi:uncharacterized protein YyaL (SSP411 family)